MQIVSERYRPPIPPTRFFSKKNLCEMLCVSRSTFERMVAVGLFPKPYQLGKRAVRWSADEVEAFISNMPRIEDAYACHVSGKGGAA